MFFFQTNGYPTLDSISASVGPAKLLIVIGPVGSGKVIFGNKTNEPPTICLGENKGADQLRRNCEADQRLCFRYTDSTIPLLSKSKISSL